MIRLPFLLISLVVVALATSACSPEKRYYDDDNSDDDGSDSDSDSDTDSDTDVDTDADTDSDTDTETDTETESDTNTGPDFNCDSLPDAPISFTELIAPRGYHDVAFDDEGNIVGGEGSALLKVSSTDETEVFVASVGTVQGMDYLPNGDLVVAKGWPGEIVQIDPFGVSSTLHTSFSAYGVRVGPYGRVFAADNSSLIRIDPDTLDVVTYTTTASPRAVNFSPELDRLYYVTFGPASIYYMDIEEDLDPIGEPTLFATGLGGTWMDGLGVDACGYLYVPVYDNHTLFRISPEGEVEIFHQWPTLQPYGHGLRWGTGEDGWSETALYMPQPYDMSTVLEVEIGVPSRTVWDE